MNFKKQYLENGYTCPKCGVSDSLGSTSSVQLSGNGATNDVECDSCDFKFTEHYVLKGVSYYDDNILKSE